MGRDAIECTFCFEVFADDVYSRCKASGKLRCTSCGRIQTIVRHVVAEPTGVNPEPGVVAVPIKEKTDAKV